MFTCRDSAACVMRSAIRPTWAGEMPPFEVMPIMKTSTLTPERLHQINAYGRAANYLSVGQIYF